MDSDARKAPRDGLDEYIRVSSSGLHVIIAAMSLVLVATIVWGFIGRIPVTLTVTGCVIGTDTISEAQSGGSNASDAGTKQRAWVICYIDSSQYSAEQIMNIREDVTIAMPDNTTFKGRVNTTSPIPLSRAEAGLFLEDGDWVAEQCVNSDYSWAVIVEVYEDVSDHVFTTPQVTFITEEVPPIRFLVR